MRPLPAKLVVTAVLLAPALLAAPAGAATFPVTKPNDTADGACDADCSLREAVIAANANAEADTIVLGAGTFTLSIPTTNEDAAANGDLDVTSDIIIRGAGAGATTIDGAGTDRVFEVLATGDLELLDLRVTGGASAGPGGGLRLFDGELRLTDVVLEGNSAIRGGAMAVEGDGQPLVTIEDSTLIGNSATGSGDGGAIYNEDHGSVSIVATTLRGNTAGGVGGAIFTQNDAATLVAASLLTGNRAELPSRGGGAFASQNQAALTVARSTVADNSTAGAGGAISAQNQAIQLIVDSTIAGNRSERATDDSFGGGGAFWQQNGVATTVVGSTVAANSAQRNGGAVFLRNDSTLTLLNSTVSDNTAPFLGGAVYMDVQGPIVRLQSSTVAGNSAGVAAGALYDDSDGGGQPFRLENALIAANTAAGAPSSCAVGPTGVGFTSLGNNLDSTASCGLTGPGDLQNANAALGPLASNGGPTQTRALLAGSAARDAGGPGCPATDQRGVTRPLGPACDIGAFEAAPIPASPTGPAPGSAPDRTRPRLTRLRLVPARLRPVPGRGPSFAAQQRPRRKRGQAPLGATLRYTLSEPARVTFRIRRATRGRRAGGRCVKPNRRNRGNRRCTRFVLLRGSFVDAGERGANSRRFTGRLRGRALRPGRYRLVSVGRDPAGNRSAAKQVGFRIVR